MVQTRERVHSGRILTWVEERYERVYRIDHCPFRPGEESFVADILVRLSRNSQ